MSQTPHTLRWIRRFGAGDLIAAAALQPDIRWFSTSFGAWPYRRVGAVDLTLGGPLCAPADQPEMLRRFLAWSRKPVLFYLRAPLLQDLAKTDADLRCAGIGVDRHVDLETLLRAPSKAVRGAVKKANKAGFELVPLPFAALDAPTRARVRQIDARYLARAAVKREMAFLNRPMSFEDDGTRRLYALSKHDREHAGIFGYAVLNAIYDQPGQRRGWLLDILRFEPTRLWGVWLSTVHALAELLAREGARLSLGFAPLHRIQRPPAATSPLLQAQLEWLMRYLSTTPYIQRLAALKAEIPGREEPRFVASYTPLAAPVLRAFLTAMGVPPRTLLTPGLARVLREGATLRLQEMRWPREPTSTPA